ncbi:lipoyl synthase [Gammaproteobacteria bacterium]
MSHTNPHKGKSKLERTLSPGTPTVPLLRKPAWIRARAPSGEGVMRIKGLLRAAALHTVCEEAACPNLGECFSNGTATFLIMGDLCTRRCPFCDVGHGQPRPLDPNEPVHLAETIMSLGLRYVVITSVDRDDLRDGGAAHFAACVHAIRDCTPEVSIEILVPDFRGRMEQALDLLSSTPPDVFNHNLETVPRLYRQVRPGADYAHSLTLLQAFANHHPSVPTKSGLMLGLGETQEEVEQVLRDLHTHGCNRITLGQYLQPSRHHLPVIRFATPDEFASLQCYAEGLGFTHVASGPMVRSSYHAELQAAGQVGLGH